MVHHQNKAMNSEPPDIIIKLGFSKSLDDCDKRIRDAFPIIETEFCSVYGPGYGLLCDYTYRGPLLQFDLFKKGRSQDASGQWVLTDRTARVTDKDGTVNKGPHNFYPSRAADVYATKDGKILWPLPNDNPLYAERSALYVALGRIWEKHGLVSGATWKYAWKDDPHVQLPSNV